MWDSNDSGKIISPTGISSGRITSFNIATGRGTFTIANGFSNGFVDSAVFYLIDAGRGFILDTTNGTDNRALAGNLQPQLGSGSFGPATLSGNIVAGSSGSSSVTLPNFDALVGAANGSFFGIADATLPASPATINLANQTFGGMYTDIDATNGRGIAAIPGAIFGQTDFATAVFYIIGPKQFVLIGTGQGTFSGVTYFDPQ